MISKRNKDVFQTLAIYRISGFVFMAVILFLLSGCQAEAAPAGEKEKEKFTVTFDLGYSGLEMPRR